MNSHGITSGRSTRASALVVGSLMLSAAAAASGQAALPTLGLREEMRIASSEAVPGMLLTPVADLTVLPDGRIVTVHTGEGVLRVFDPSGRLLKIVGRKGSGPGEFRLPLTVGYVGDTLWVRDTMRRAYLRFGPSFEPMKSVTMVGNGGFYYGLTSGTTSLLRPTTGDTTKIGIFDNDSLVTPIRISFRLTGHQFEVRDVVLNPAGGPPTGTRIRVAQSPLVATTHMALAPGGAEAVVVESAEHWGGQPGQFNIRRIETATGRISAPIVVSLPPRRVAPAEADSLIKRNATRMSSTRAQEEYREKAKVAATYPALMSFMVASDGALWLTRHAEPAMRTVVDRDGTPAMRVRLPEGVSVFAASATYVWGVLRDGDDLPIILRYRILGVNPPP